MDFTHRHFMPLDWIRGLAAIFVAGSHFFMQFSQDYSFYAENFSIISVEIFFILSGFVLSPQIMIFFQSQSFRNTKVFFYRRWIRTLPPFLIALLAMSIISGNWLSNDFFLYLTFCRNFFNNPTEGDFFSIAWSLSVEEWFYVAFPLFLHLFRIRFKNVIFLTSLFILTIFLLKICLSLMFEGGIQNARRVTFFRLDSIAFGILLHIGGLAVIKKRWFWRSITPVFFGLGFCLFNNLVDYRANTSLIDDLTFCYLASLFCSTIILIACRLDALLSRFKWLATAGTFLSQVSYPIYLLHPLFLAAANNRLFPTTLWIIFPGYLVTLMAAAWYFNRAIEQPLLKLRPHYKNIET